MRSGIKTAGALRSAGAAYRRKNAPGMRKSLLRFGDPLTDEEELEADRVVGELALQVRTKRIDLKWKLKDYDTKSSSTSTMHEHISADQFKRCLSEFGLLHHTQDVDAQLLVKKYAPTDGRHEPGKFVNYRRFLLDIDHTFDPKMHSGSIRLDGESAMTLDRPSRLNPLGDQLAMLSIRPSTKIGGPTRGPGAVLASIVEHLSIHRIRVSEYLRDGDPLRHGILSRHKFRVALTSAKLDLSHSEFLDLCAQFATQKAKDPAGADFVDYARFLEAVQLGIGEGDQAADTTLVRRPDTSHAQAFKQSFDAPVTPGRQNPESHGAGLLLDEEAVFACASAVAEIARLCGERRLDLRQSFQDFDKQNRGYVSSAVFDRVLTLSGVRPALPASMKVLLAKFADSTPDSRVDINYKAFAEAVSQIQTAQTAPQMVMGAAEFRSTTRSKSAGLGNLAEYDNRTVMPEAVEPLEPPVQAALCRIAIQLEKSKGRLLDFFKDGDVLRGGELSTFKFRSALGRAGLLVDDGSFAALAKTFASKKRRAEMVDWRAFHDALNETKAMMGHATLSNQKGAKAAQASLIVDPGTPLGMGSPGMTRGAPEEIGLVGRPPTGHVQWDDAATMDTAAMMEDLLDEICSAVSTKRILVKPFFQDLDRNNENTVTQYQMGSVLSQNVGLDLTSQQRQLLFEAFAKKDVHGNPTNRFDYKAFVKRVDAVETA
mmetsp:Transcript_46050/g.104015  ORF Transcript_46050/g.104015 Transcript_46050/m.104015 type:complete len:712 (+) Transcript_46050:559-2694(+)